MSSRFIVLVPCVLALSSCSSGGAAPSDAAVPVDSVLALDAGADTGPMPADAGPTDAPRDAAADVGVDVPVDTGADAGQDVGVDVGVEASRDAAVAPDVPVDAGAPMCDLTTSVRNGVGMGVPEIRQTSPHLVGGIQAEAVPCGIVATNEDAMQHMDIVHPGVPFYYRLTKATYVPTVTMEMSAPTSVGGTSPQSNIRIFPTATASTTIPGFDSTRASMYLHVEARTIGCATGGWTLTVNGNPGARVSFWNHDPANGGEPTATAAPAGSTEFYISIAGLAPAGVGTVSFTTVGGTGPCNVVFVPTTTNTAYLRTTGRVALEAGAVTSAAALGM
jgi:hypothetical protein